MVKFKDMKTVEVQALPAPPSLTGSLMAGFDAITNHIEIILIPVALDLFLWMGARLRLAELINVYLKYLASVPGMETAETEDMLQLLQEFWLFVAERFNLFTMLRSYPIGIPSLMVSWQPASSPVGILGSFEVPSFIALAGLWLLLTVLGLVLGTFFYLAVAQASLKNKLGWRRILRRLPWSAGQVILLALMWAVLILVVSIPASCLVSLISLGGYSLGQLGLLIFGGLILWMILPLLFSTHGIIINRRHAWASVLDSIRVTRFTMPKTAVLFIIIFIIDEGLGMLWSIPNETSWFVLIGLFGHAFIVTGLLAASFVYYRDAYRWVQKLLQEAKLSSMS